MRNHIYGLTCGYQYVRMMNAAATDLRQTSKDLPHIMPFPIMMDTFDEIAGRHEEELEGKTRTIYRKPVRNGRARTRSRRSPRSRWGSTPMGRPKAASSHRRQSSSSIRKTVTIGR